MKQINIKHSYILPHLNKQMLLFIAVEDIIKKQMLFKIGVLKNFAISTGKH